MIYAMRASTTEIDIFGVDFRLIFGNLKFQLKALPTKRNYPNFTIPFTWEIQKMNPIFVVGNHFFKYFESVFEKYLKRQLVWRLMVNDFGMSTLLYLNVGKLIQVLFD